MLLQPGDEEFSPLLIFTVLGMLGFAGRDLASRAAPRALDNAVLGFWGFFALILAGLFYGAWEGYSYHAPSGAAWLILGLAIGAGVFAYSGLMVAMRTGEVGFVTPFRYTRLLFGLGIGLAFMNEELSWPMIIGSMIVVGAGLVLMRPERRV